ncbi:hypothetical protein GCM10023322_51950 [Rugosimonospora acidiphila]|uniref:Lipoprotein n=1 Tax=Rugosimonospora acidiphila TaxID=556531 RepID=A0ABP9SAJ7_9ACTN
MLRKHVVPLAALLAAGAVALLSACQAAPIVPAAQVAAPPPASAQAPAGTSDLSLLSGTAKSNNAPMGTGDWAMPNGGEPIGAAAQLAPKWVQLTASSAGNLDPVVVNGAGLTLYRFDKDIPNSTSNCNDTCATMWPPVTIDPGGKIFIAGIDQAAVGTITRADGTRQVSIDGWPVYRFANDTKRGDTLGQGFGGTWFGVTPTGGKAGAPADNAGQPTPSASAAQPATTAVLFDDANFSDNGASQGVAGSGCQNVSRPGVASSVAAPGSLKLWSQPNCTGESVVINGDVSDLATINFDNKVASVFFG